MEHEFSNPTPETPAAAEPVLKPRWKTARLVLGILMMVLFVLITFQSCAAGLGNALTNNGEMSGSVGFISAILLLSAGIVGVATRASVKRGGCIAVCILTWLVYFLSRMGAGSYADLRIWGVIAFVFGCVYLFSVVRSRKQLTIAAAVSLAYLILGLV